MKLLGVLVLSAAVAATLSDRAAAEERKKPHAVQGDAHRENRWRYVWHNDRWWYWTAGERWNYFDGRRWITFDSRGSSAAAAGRYRKAAAFERPPAAPPRPPLKEPANLGWLGSGAPTQTGVLPAPVSRDGLFRPPSSSLLGERVRAPSNGLRNADRDGSPGAPGHLGRKKGGTKGGGAFGGPTGGSFGAGSAVGGASTPQSLLERRIGHYRGSLSFG